GPCQAQDDEGPEPQGHHRRHPDHSSRAVPPDPTTDQQRCLVHLPGVGQTTRQLGNVPPSAGRDRKATHDLSSRQHEGTPWLAKSNSPTYSKEFQGIPTVSSRHRSSISIPA